MSVRLRRELGLPERAALEGAQRIRSLGHDPGSVACQAPPHLGVPVDGPHEAAGFARYARSAGSR